MIIAFHNHKGGIGTTTLAAHLCVLAKELGIPVAGVSADFKKELPRFLEPEKIPCIELDPRREDIVELRVAVKSQGNLWGETWLYRWSR